MPDAEGRRLMRQRVFSAASWSAMAAILVASIVLLSLASVTPSPKPPGASNMQTERGDECNNPQIFVALLSVSSARLGLSLLATSWIFLRQRRSRKAAEKAVRDRLAAIELGEDVEGAHEPPRNPAASTHSLPRPLPASRPPSTAPPDGNRASAGISAGVYGSPSSTYRRLNTSVVTFATAATNTSPRSTSPPAPLYTVPQDMPIGPNRHASMPSLATAAQSVVSLNPAAAASNLSLSSQRFSGSGSVSPAAHLYTFPPPADAASLASPRTSVVAAPTAQGSMPSLHPAASTLSLGATSGSTPHAAAQSTLSLASVAMPAPTTAHASTINLAYPPPPAQRRLSQSSRYPEPYVPKSERRAARKRKWASIADGLANSVLGTLAVVNFVLWIIGSAVCFAQLPDVAGQSCYVGSPLLWWGLMTTTIIFGWLHAAYYIYMVVVALLILIASAIYLILAFVMGWPIRPMGMVRPRTPQPERLTDADLASCPLVAYIPDPSEPLPEPSIYDGASKAESVHSRAESLSRMRASALLKKAMGRDNSNTPSSPIEPPSKPQPKGVPIQPGEADPSRLNGLPGVVLSAHQVTCAICQSSFLPPREVPGKAMYEVETLRQLPCKHVFHQECVDNWLTNHSGVCPYCSQNVKDMLSEAKKKGEALVTVASVPEAGGTGRAPVASGSGGQPTGGVCAGASLEAEGSGSRERIEEGSGPCATEREVEREEEGGRGRKRGEVKGSGTVGARVSERGQTTPPTPPVAPHPTPNEREREP